MGIFGVVLYLLLSGTFPRDMSSDVPASPLPPLKVEAEQWQAVSSETVAIVKQLLAEVPAERPSASQILDSPWKSSEGAPLVAPAAHIRVARMASSQSRAGSKEAAFH